MSTLLIARDAVKLRLAINNTSEDARIDDEIRAVIRQLQGKPYWFLRKTDTVAISAGVTSVAAPADFGILGEAELIYGGRRYSEGDFRVIDFKELRRDYWYADPVPDGIKPEAVSIVNTVVYLSCTTTAASTLYLDYYRKDTAALANPSDTSVFLADESLDVVVAAAQALFEKRSTGDKTADLEVMNSFISKLDREHERRVS